MVKHQCFNFRMCLISRKYFKHLHIFNGKHQFNKVRVKHRCITPKMHINYIQIFKVSCQFSHIRVNHHYINLKLAPDRTKKKFMAASISNFWNDYELGKGTLIQPHNGKSPLYQSQTADRTKNKLMAASISNFWNDYELGKGVNDYLLAQTSRKQRKQKLSVKRSNANLLVFTGHNIYLTQQQRATKLAREKRKLILCQRRIAKHSSSSRRTTPSSTITFDNIEQQLSVNENEIPDNTSLQRHFERQNMIRDIARDLSSAYESYEAINRLRMEDDDLQDLEGYDDIGDPIYTCTKCGAQMWYGERDRMDTKSVVPSFTMCCKNRIVELPFIKNLQSCYVIS
ncbi:uncharacterized protein LOC141600306 isoform X1 [Silene latifolia]|uniref:uncharacterized protein LOC141600306 isoform X1 n=1 Tax=Silene latifolia TaxID=37657 RepID=UPI003D772044